MRRFLVAVSLVVLAAVSGAEAEDVVTRRVSGRVVAADIKASPNTIVIKSKDWRGRELIVGAAVTSATAIAVGNKPAKLEDLREGDTVEMLYERNLNVTAKSITVRR